MAVTITILNAGNMAIGSGESSSEHSDTWYKYDGDTEWRHVNIEGTLALVDSMEEATGQIDNPFDIVAIEVGTSVTHIGDSSFKNCQKLTSITIPSSVLDVADYAFDCCEALENVTIGNSVGSIGYSAFINCSSLTDITIPVSVTSIGLQAFNGCGRLTSVTFEGKTMEQVQEMDNYPWEIYDTSIINVA